MLTPEQQMLCERHVPLAVGIARRMHLNFETWDETRSDALMGLVRAAHRYQPPYPFAPYARKFIEGSVRHGRRKRTGYRNGQVHLPPVLVPLDDVQITDGGLSLDERMNAREIWGLIDGLPDREAAAVRLYYEQDLPQTEIALMLGVNQMMVSRLLDRARARLRERIEA